MSTHVNGRERQYVATVTRTVAWTLTIGMLTVVAAGCGGTSTLSGITKGSPAATGQALFESAGCTGCHSIKGQGGVMGPDLTDVGTLNKTANYIGTLPVPLPGVTGPVYSGKNWFVLHTQCPTCATPGSPMPAFTSFTAQQYLALAAFLGGLGVTEK